MGVSSFLFFIQSYSCIGGKDVSEYRRVTRSVKHDKRQKQKRKILFFGSLAVLFFVIFISLILFGNKGNPEQASLEQTEDNTDEIDDDEHQDDTNIDEEQSSEDEDTTLEPKEDENDEEQDVILEEIESDDANVIKAYKGNWDPVGTEQEGPHTTTYEEGSTDRIEIQRAVVMVTGIEEDNMIEHWIGRGGEQEVIATVSDHDLENYYRVYLQWVDEEGWQPTMIEELKQYP